LGKDTEGAAFVTSLDKMPHLLVAGATGTGKSVSINAMICSILYKATPQDVRLLMVDPKMLELPIYNGIPHLLLPVVTNPKKAVIALKWAVDEMERRYQLLAMLGTRNIDGYNKKIEKGEYDEDKFLDNPFLSLEEKESGDIPIPRKLPYIVIIVDELADLMMTGSKDVEEHIMRLAQMARAAGIHLILATQRPSVDVITGLIKANIPSRISFKVTSRVDSRTILDNIGSEKLLGNGDMLFMPPGSSKLRRLHGSFITEKEIATIVGHLKDQGKPEYNEEILRTRGSTTGGDIDEENDEMYDQAVALVAEHKQASISFVQRRLRIGYNRAARIIETMESQGVIGPQEGSKPRQVLISEASA
jgi:S-DNA-T family DNA segregation ATPase FtsK/SpoIIIE